MLDGGTKDYEEIEDEDEEVLESVRFLNIFHKAKAKTLANESQQTWTNQFRSWLSKNTAYGPIINFPGKLYEVNVGTCVYV